MWIATFRAQSNQGRPYGNEAMATIRAGTRAGPYEAEMWAGPYEMGGRPGMNPGKFWPVSWLGSTKHRLWVQAWARSSRG